MSTTVWRSERAVAGFKQTGYREFVLVPSGTSGEYADASYGSETGLSPRRAITVKSTSLADAEAIASHCAYLGRMVTESVVPPEVSAKARRVWEDARRAVPKLPVPAAVAYDGGPIHYTWDNGRHQVTVEVPGNGSCEWYVSDRQTGAFDGGEFDAADGLPKGVVAGLQLVTL